MRASFCRRSCGVISSPDAAAERASANSWIRLPYQREALSSRPHPSGRVKRLPGGSEQDHAALLAADAARMRAMADEAGAALLPAFAYPYGALDANAEKALRAAGMQATMTSEEHSNTLTRSPECLFRLGRFERTGFMTTAQLLAKLK